MKILITRPRAQSESFANALRAAGFEPIFFPVIEIRPIENNTALERALQQLNCYAWIVFTSVNAVDMVFSPSSLRPSPAGRENRDEGEGVRVAAVGSKTAEALRKHNIEPDLVPDEFIPEAMLPKMGDLKDKWILLPRAEIARKDLPEAISKAGGIAHEISVYKTLPAQVDPDGLSALKSGVDVITLTSPSTVQNFIAIAKQNGLDPLNLPNSPRFACIGPITERAAMEEGLPNLIIAKEYTTDGLMAVIKELEVL